MNGIIGYGFFPKYGDICVDVSWLNKGHIWSTNIIFGPDVLVNSEVVIWLAGFRHMVLTETSHSANQPYGRLYGTVDIIINCPTIPQYTQI